MNIEFPVRIMKPLELRSKMEFCDGENQFKVFLNRYLSRF